MSRRLQGSGWRLSSGRQERERARGVKEGQAKPWGCRHLREEEKASKGGGETQ